MKTKTKLSSTGTKERFERLKRIEKANAGPGVKPLDTAWLIARLREAWQRLGVQEEKANRA